MLSDYDDSGILAFMIGLIVLVFAGVGLSIAMDRRFSFSSNVSSFKRDIKAGELELDQLREMCRVSSWDLVSVEPERLRAVSARNALMHQIAALQQRRSALTASRDDLSKSINAIEHEFSLYRERIRETLWNSAVGQSLGTLKTRNGREYRDAVITRVTEVGLEIRHAHGTARLQAPDLDSSLQERFQWGHRIR